MPVDGVGERDAFGFRGAIVERFDKNGLGSLRILAEPFHQIGLIRSRLGPPEPAFGGGFGNGFRRLSATAAGDGHHGRQSKESHGSSHTRAFSFGHVSVGLLDSQSLPSFGCLVKRRLIAEF